MLPKRTGDKVLAYVLAQVATFNSELLKNKPEGLQLETRVVDPLDYPSVTNLQTQNGNPTYYASKDPSSGPEDLAKLVRLVDEADCFLVVTPEYNHTIPPCLTAILNQVGCSKYAHKVSGCVCYSGFPSAAGGARCAVALRPYLSELGCLPVSKQTIIPNANAALNDAGEWVGEHKEGGAKVMQEMLSQLQWWADACAVKRQRDVA